MTPEKALAAKHDAYMERRAGISERDLKFRYQLSCDNMGDMIERGQVALKEYPVKGKPHWIQLLACLEGGK